MATNGTITNASSTYGTISTLWSNLATIPEFNFTNATGTRLMATNGTITNASTTYATLPTFWGTTGTVTNLTATNGTIANASSTYQTISDTAWLNNLVAANATTTTFRASGLATFGGNVGIGTTTPSARLSVHGDSYLYGNLTVTGTGGIDSNLTVTGQIFLSDGTAAAPSLAFTNGINLGLFKAGTDILGFATSGSEKMRIDASGNVGIGTTTTSYAQVNIGNNLAVLGTASSSFNGIVQFSGVPTGTDVNKGSIYLNSNKWRYSQSCPPLD